MVYFLPHPVLLHPIFPTTRATGNKIVVYKFAQRTPSEEGDTESGKYLQNINKRGKI